MALQSSPSTHSTHSTACPLDCPDSCSLEVEVENGRVTRVEGSHINPLTRGFICSKVRRLPEHLYGPDRLLRPARRVGKKGLGRFEDLTWDQALELLCEQFEAVRRRHGGEAILPLSYGGSNGLLSQDTTDARLFYRLGASRLARTVCAAPSTAAAKGLYGKMPGVALEDYEEARLIVVWGANPSVTGIHLVPIIGAARERGARLIVVDPRRTPLAKKADLHLAPRPGTDLGLALAVIRELFGSGRADSRFLAEHCHGADTLRERAEAWTIERAASTCGVDEAAIRAFVELYATSSPAVIRCGWGVERNRNGGSAIASILALPAVAGKFGVRGGGYTMSNSGAWRFASAAAATPPASREINMNRLGRSLLELDRPPIELLFVYNANPLATLPDQQRVRAGLEREDLFTVVFDQVLTDTARYADLVLPATAFVEHHDLARGYGAMVLHPVLPVADAPGEARSNVEVFAELCQRLDLSEPGDETEPAALGRQLLEGGGVAVPAAGTVAAPVTGFRPVQFVDCFPITPDRKVDLCPESLDREAPLGLYGYREREGAVGYPLALISPATSRTISSTFGQLARRQAALEMHPGDAAERGLGDGDSVRVYNELGEVRCAVRANPDLRAGVAMLPKGLWARSTASGTTANALVPDSLTDLGAGACFNDARVEVEAAAS